MSFARRSGDPIAPTAGANGFDEISAKRVEHQLSELGGRIHEARATVPYLLGALDEPPCSELLERIDLCLDTAVEELGRLCIEARKEMRGE